MKRRALLQASMGILASSSAIAANQVVGMSPMGFIVHRAWVTHPSLVRQNCPQWCWAASISMIFSSNGHPVQQQRIVQTTFGAQLCAPSGNPITIARDLSRSWIDDSGTPFQSNVAAAYDAWNGVNNLSNAFIVNQLENDKPLLYCNTHHAMVLVAVDYIDTPAGPNVIAAGVLDPYPTTPGFHPLSPAEIVPTQLGGQMTFLAAVDI
jgi:hypothetical protein